MRIVSLAFMEPGSHAPLRSIRYGTAHEWACRNDALYDTICRYVSVGKQANMNALNHGVIMEMGMITL